MLWQGSAGPCGLPGFIPEQGPLVVSRCWMCSLRHQVQQEALEANYELLPG